MEDPTSECGPDKRVRPQHGRACLSCPPKRKRRSNVKKRTRRARPSESGPDRQVPPSMNVACAEGFRDVQTSYWRQRTSGGASGAILNSSARSYNYRTQRQKPRAFRTGGGWARFLRSEVPVEPPCDQAERSTPTAMARS